jgi:hypothetical protein
MDQPSVPRVSYAGRTTCLRCDQLFHSWDRRQNRLCPRCRQALTTQPSDEDSHRVSTRRHPAPDD